MIIKFQTIHSTAPLSAKHRFSLRSLCHWPNMSFTYVRSGYMRISGRVVYSKCLSLRFCRWYCLLVTEHWIHRSTESSLLSDLIMHTLSFVKFAFTLSVSLPNIYRVLYRGETVWRLNDVICGGWKGWMSDEMIWSDGESDFGLFFLTFIGCVLLFLSLRLTSRKIETTDWIREGEN